MSTSLETSRKASPSNNDERERSLKRAAVISAAALAVLILARIPFGSLVEQVGERREARAGVAPLVEQARLWPMGYETAEAGKPVVWCIDHPSRDVTYLNGDPGHPLLWSNRYPVPLNVGGSGGRCANVLAVVEGREARGLKLRFVQAL